MGAPNAAGKRLQTCWRIAFEEDEVEVGILLGRQDCHRQDFSPDAFDIFERCCILMVTAREYEKEYGFEKTP
jgi:hypothetical protein